MDNGTRMVINISTVTFCYMDINEFIKYWKGKRDHDDTPAVGIGINWDKIPQTSIVQQYFGEEAWNRIGDFYAPVWGGFKRTQLNEWLNPKRDDYDKFIAEEEAVGKIDLYRKNGLMYTYFCAFADKDGHLGVVGDGCHRYIDLNYLIMKGDIDGDEIKKSRLDLIYLDNLEEVLGTSDYEIIEEAKKVPI